MNVRVKSVCSLFVDGNLRETETTKLGEIKDESRRESKYRQRKDRKGGQLSEFNLRCSKALLSVNIF